MPGMRVVWSCPKGLVQRCFSALWAVKRHLARSHLRQRVVMVRHGVNDDLEVVNGFVPMRQSHLGFCTSQACKQEIWRLHQEALGVLERALRKVASEVGRASVEPGPHVGGVEREGLVVPRDGIVEPPSAGGNVASNVGDEGAFAADVGRVCQALGFDVVAILQRQKGRFRTQCWEVFLEQATGPRQGV